MAKNIGIEGRVIPHTFCFPESFNETLEEFTKIARREGKSRGDLIKEFIQDYTKKHGSGNPIYPMDEWIKDPKFKAIPAVMTDKHVWFEYLTGIQNKREKQEIINHIRLLNTTANKAERMTLIKK